MACKVDAKDTCESAGRRGESATNMNWDIQSEAIDKTRCDMGCVCARGKWIQPLLADELE